MEWVEELPVPTLQRMGNITLFPPTAHVVVERCDHTCVHTYVCALCVVLTDTHTVLTGSVC